VADNELFWLIHPTPTTELEGQQDSILPAIATALVTITATAWKTAQRLNNRRSFAASGAEGAKLIDLLNAVIKRVLT